MAEGKQGKGEMIASHLCFSWRYSLAVGAVLIWTSVIVIPYGAHLQTLSPRLQEYERHEMARMVAVGFHGPGAGIGLALSSFWPFVAAFCVVIGLLFIFCVLILRSIAGWNRDLALVASGIFLAGCFLGAFAHVQGAIGHLRWGFVVLGVGELLAAAGLIFGAFGAIGYCRSRDRKM